MEALGYITLHAAKEKEETVTGDNFNDADDTKNPPLLEYTENKSKKEELYYGK